MRRRSLTATFAMVSLVAMVTLAVALVVTVAKVMQRQALSSAVATAQAYVNSGVVGHVPDSAFGASATLPVAEKQQLDQFVAQSRNAPGTSTGGLLAARLWNASSQLVYDSRDQSRAGFPNGTQLDTALTEGRAAPAVKKELNSATGQPSSGGRVLDVYLPLTSGTTDKRVGAAEVILDYGPTEVAVSKVLRDLALLIAGGLVLLWLLLFRTVMKASHRLRASASENARLALLDPLTGLPNRRLFTERLERAAERSRESGEHIGLLLLDVDRFKEINDSLGHDRGDDLLVQIAARLRGLLREGDTVARLGGDEFAILLPDVNSVADAQEVAGRLLSAFTEPYDLDELVLHVETSAGLALMPDHAGDEVSLLRRADVAMYVAKSSRQGLSTCTVDGQETSTAKLVLLGDLRLALDTHDQLQMHYQPKVDLATGEVNGLEALLRWRHPRRGMLPPGEFIPLAETTGLMHLLTARVLELVCRQLQAWLVDGWDLPVAVNLSALNLAEPQLVADIRRILTHTNVPAELLEFEITESAIVADPVRAAVVLRQLRALGATVALDDFGIGNTSISQLRDLPVQTLKIDRSFVQDLAAGSDVLVKVITDLGHEFGMTVIAEGVEDAATAQRLLDLGCDVGQGYWYSRPVDGTDLHTVLGSLVTRSRTVPVESPRSVAI